MLVAFSFLFLLRQRRIVVWAELDGDEFGEATAVSVRVEERALRLAVPTGHTSPNL